MTGLDTNVLVRYLTQDDPAQCGKANAAIEGLTARGERCFVGAIVLCELVWVLRGAYDLDKRETILALEKILATVELAIEDKDLVHRALDDYRTGKGDFADYLIGWRNRKAGCGETITFDGSLRGDDLFRVL